jgi:hypothetical protein
MPTLTTLFALIHYFCDTISWKFLAFISFITWCGTFYVAPCPTKRKVMSYHVLRPFFAGLVWNSSMASWACFILDSFTQDASIGWYPFHLIKYSCFRPLSCLNLRGPSLQILVHYVLVGLWVMLSIKPWGIASNRLQKKNMKCGVNFKIFWYS